MKNQFSHTPSQARLLELSIEATTHKQRIPLMVRMSRLTEGYTFPTAALRPAGAFAAVALIMFALYAAPSATDERDMVATLEQTDLLVMLEENLY